MLEEKIINETANFIKDKVVSAEAEIDGEIKEVQIMRKEVVDNLLKIFLILTKEKGAITNIYLKDEDGDVIISKPRNVIKTSTFGLVSSFYIRLVEMEIDDPINIFEMSGKGGRQ